MPNDERGEHESLEVSAEDGEDPQKGIQPLVSRWICPKCDEPNKAARERCNGCDAICPFGLVAAGFVVPTLKAAESNKEAHTKPDVANESTPAAEVLPPLAETQTPQECSNRSMEPLPCAEPSQDETMPQLEPCSFVGGEQADETQHSCQAALAQKWVCVKCDEPNKAERDSCNNCGHHRPTEISKQLDPPFLPNLQSEAKWTCPKCDEPNKKERDRCNNCGWVRRSLSVLSIDSTDDETNVPKVTPDVPPDGTPCTASAANLSNEGSNKSRSRSHASRKRPSSSSSSSSMSTSNSSSSSSRSKARRKKKKRRHKKKERRRKIKELARQAAERHPMSQVERKNKILEHMSTFVTQDDAGDEDYGDDASDEPDDVASYVPGEAFSMLMDSTEFSDSEAELSAAAANESADKKTGGNSKVQKFDETGSKARHKQSCHTGTPASSESTGSSTAPTKTSVRGEQRLPKLRGSISLSFPAAVPCARDGSAAPPEPAHVPEWLSEDADVAKSAPRDVKTKKIENDTSRDTYRVEPSNGVKRRRGSISLCLPGQNVTDGNSSHCEHQSGPKLQDALKNTNRAIRQAKALPRLPENEQNLTNDGNTQVEHQAGPKLQDALKRANRAIRQTKILPKVSVDQMLTVNAEANNEERLAIKVLSRHVVRLGRSGALLEKAISKAYHAAPTGSTEWHRWHFLSRPSGLQAYFEEQCNVRKVYECYEGNVKRSDKHIRKLLRSSLLPESDIGTETENTGPWLMPDDMVNLPISDIRFAHDSQREHFGHLATDTGTGAQRSVLQLAVELLLGITLPWAVPTIRVCQYEDNWFCYTGNRRLAAYRLANRFAPDRFRRIVLPAVPTDDLFLHGGPGMKKKITTARNGPDCVGRWLVFIETGQAVGRDGIGGESEYGADLLSLLPLPDFESHESKNSTAEVPLSCKE